ncbi:alpha/beta hydrolase-fold protein [Aquimarina sp. 2201CG5-10]|uniref:alpha/beta hydrolase-fold protein n=1 Tax=Aquimarina callyspongiae TaxID=3098150 RepID=UPI002AB56D67|nr:alpha/beta hydrolase-fold protein [Aquimarina sp. 2201CG5-10]MDY8136563.1 alpha/beta hydrolase-fold protein [Aquimarina sp. 2201CG5-10]
MKNYIFILFLCTLQMWGQHSNNNRIDTVKINSKFLNEVREVKIVLPYDYDKSTKSYPIIVVLDDQLIFSTMTAIVNHLSATSRMPESIIVTIPKGKQHRSYYAPNLYSYSKQRNYNYGNHQEELSAFLEKELIPILTTKYRTANFRTIVGFSPSSVFTLDLFCENRKLFQAYIALASGNIIGDGYTKDKNFIHIIENSLTSSLSNKTYLYVVSGGRDLISNPNIKNNIASFNQKISKGSISNLSAKGEIIHGEGHTDVLLPGIISAFDLIYPKEQWIVDYVETINKEGNAKENIDAFYNNLSQQYGFKIYPNMNRLYSMNCIKNIGRRLLKQGRVSEAIELFQYWVKLYPHSSNAHAYLGLSLKVAQKFTESIKSYKKAIEISERESNPETSKYKESLNELKTSINKR